MAVDDRPAILKLRKAMLFIILGSVILLLGVLVTLGYSNQIKNNFSYSDLIIPLLLLLIGGATALLGTLDVYRGFTMMEYIGKVYDIGRYGALAQFAESILLIAGVYLIIFSGSLPERILGSGFTLTGYIIGLICAFPVGIAFYKLGERYRVPAVRRGAIVYILLPVIGPLLLYFGLKEILGK